MDQDLKKTLVTSLLFHVCVVLVFTVQAVIFPSTAIDYHSAMKVDLLGLPDKKAPEAVPEPPKPVEKVVVTEKKKSVDLKKTKKAEENALSKLKRMQALDTLKNIKEEKKETTTAKAESKPIKNNILSPGTALKGLNRIQFDDYIGELDSRVKKNWALPEWLSQKDLKAKVLVKIDKAGLIIEKSLIEASGNAEYDRRVMEAVDSSSPFPLPPEKFQALLSVNGVTFGFPE